jgi:streptomycin 3"-adenylyltransferase
MELAAPQHITHLLDEIVAAFKHLLGENLVGVYLHGSLAMGSFNPDSSDIDFLVIAKDKLPPQKRSEVAVTMIELSEKAPAKGLEMSILTVDALRDFRYPTPYDFHFSQSWLDRYKRDEVDLSQEDRVDADLAAHLSVTKARGITLYGPPIETVFPDIPSKHYLASILQDAKCILEDMSSDPVYNVLNLCRVQAFMVTASVMSKREGGEWALHRATSFLREVIEQALAEYAGRQKAQWDRAALIRFGQEMAEQLGL